MSCALQLGNRPRLRITGLAPVVRRVVDEKLPLVRVEGPNRLVVLNSCSYLPPVEREPKAPVVSFYFARQHRSSIIGRQFGLEELEPVPVNIHEDMTYLYSKADIVHLARLVVAKVARKAVKIIRRSFDHLEGPASEVFRVELDSAITRMHLPEGGYLFAAPHLPHLKPDDSFFVH